MKTNQNIIEPQGCSGMAECPPPDPCVAVIFGASGDLAHRELIPSLFSLSCKGLLPRQFAIVGFARKEWSDERFRQRMEEAVKEHGDFREEPWQDFVPRLYYQIGDFNADPGGAYAELRDKIETVRSHHGIPNNLLFHLSTPPDFYDTIVRKLQAAELSQSEEGWRRVIIEKPFGRDRDSARSLDKNLRKVLDEEQIYRVDHYLGKETVQNMLVFRFANPGFEPIWNHHYIDHVQITVAEDLGIGGRGGFYERTGVLRDMLQNHLLQLLCMTAIDPPDNYDSTSLRAETLKVLRAIPPIDPRRDSVLGQYDQGKINGEKVPAYRGEDNVDEASQTPTFVALRLQIDDWRWAGVPFYLRTGKRLSRKQTEITLQFKPTPHLMFPVDNRNGREPLPGNRLTFRLYPDEGIANTFIAKQPGAEICLQPVQMNFRYHDAFGVDEPPSAYEWLLHDAIQGDQTLFPHAEWIYRAWSILDPLIKQWESDPWLEFPNYPAGSWGPKRAQEWIQQHNHKWLLSEP